MTREIGEWLDALGLGRYAETFVTNEIDLNALPHITEEDLKEISVAHMEQSNVAYPHF